MSPRSLKRAKRIAPSANKDKNFGLLVKCLWSLATSNVKRLCTRGMMSCDIGGRGSVEVSVAEREGEGDLHFLASKWPQN